MVRRNKNKKRKLIGSEIVETIGEYTIVKTKEKMVDVNGKPYGRIHVWYDSCLDHGDGDIVASYDNIKKHASGQRRIIMYNELHMENMLEIGRVIQSMFDEDKLEHYDSKEVFMDALSWAQEFEDQYDEDNDYYYDAIDEFVRQKIEDKFKEYYEDNG